MFRTIWIVTIAPVLVFSLTSLASPQSQNQRLCADSLVGTTLKTKRKFAKEVAVQKFNNFAAAVMRYHDSTEIISEVRSKRTKEVVFVVAVKYRYQADSLAPLEQSLYEVVIATDGNYSVEPLNMTRKPM